MRYWLLARCQQAVWAYEEWNEGGPIPTWHDGIFGVLALVYGPVLR